jgi:hypothetical protein
VNSPEALRLPSSIQSILEVSDDWEQHGVEVRSLYLPDSGASPRDEMPWFWLGPDLLPVKPAHAGLDYDRHPQYLAVSLAVSRDLSFLVYVDIFAEIRATSRSQACRLQERREMGRAV